MKIFEKIKFKSILPKVLTMCQRHTAFTLAEILIVLGIIGIIAALTIPTLMQNFQDSELSTATKAMTSILTQAVNKASVDNDGIITGSDPDDSSNYYNKFISEFKIVKSCPGTQPLAGNCWSTNSHYLNDMNSDAADWVQYFAGYILTNGSYLATYNHPICNETDSCIDLIFDVNGKRGPNIVGRDIFDAYITTKGFYIPSYYDYWCTPPPTTYSGRHCLGYALGK